MATIMRKRNKDGSFRYSVRYCLNGKTGFISFGKVYADKIDLFCRCIEEIKTAIECYGDGARLKKSLEGILEENPILKEKLQKAGLITVPKIYSLNGIWEIQENHADRMGYKETTSANYESSKLWFLRYFDGRRPADSITELEAQEFRAWLERQNNKYGKTLKPSSVNGYIKVIKTVFRTAYKKRVINSNPFDGIKKGKMNNPERQYEVKASWIPHILEACPTQSWRVYITLLRIGGLRKMEPMYLKWSDILWDRGRFYVTSPKTERYEGHSGRFCPLWKELRQELSDLWEVTEPGTEYVLDNDVRLRSESAVYNKVKKIVISAGYIPWEKLLVNMRATRVSELKRAGFSSDQRTAWFGHSEEVSSKHYQIENILVDDTDFSRAIELQTVKPEYSEIPESENGYLNGYLN